MYVWVASLEKKLCRLVSRPIHVGEIYHENAETEVKSKAGGGLMDGGKVCSFLSFVFTLRDYLSRRLTSSVLIWLLASGGALTDAVYSHRDAPTTKSSFFNQRVVNAQTTLLVRQSLTPRLTQPHSYQRRVGAVQPQGRIVDLIPRQDYLVASEAERSNLNLPQSARRQSSGPSRFLSRFDTQDWKSCRSNGTTEREREQIIPVHWTVYTHGCILVVILFPCEEVVPVTTVLCTLWVKIASGLHKYCFPAPSQSLRMLYKGPFSLFPTQIQTQMGDFGHSTCCQSPLGTFDIQYPAQGHFTIWTVGAIYNTALYFFFKSLLVFWDEVTEGSASQNNLNSSVIF